MKRLILAAGVAAAALAGGAGAADASTAQLQREVDGVLRHSAPGGRQVSPNKVEWRRAGVTLTLHAPGARRGDGWKLCPRRYACLWQDVGYESRRIQFFHYRTYQLRAYGMPPFTHKGASSYYNNQTGGAKAILHADFDFSMVGRGSLFGALNDRGRSITLAP
jgi:hypothetical protein